MARLKEYPGNLHHPSTADLQMRVDLHSTVGGSDKVYVLTILKHKSNGTFQVVCYNGRRGHGLTTQNYSTWGSYQQAKSDLRTRQRAKESKGYKFMHEEEVTAQGTLTSSPGQVNQMRTTTPGSTPNSSITTLQNNVSVKLKEVIQPTSKATLSKLGGMKTMPNMSTTDTTAFLKHIRSDDYVVFKLETMRLHYAFLEGYNWILYDAFDTSQRPTPEYFDMSNFPGLNTNAAVNLGGLGWLGITDNNGRFIITDLVNVPSIVEVYKKPWAARRQMMNVIYDQLFPGVDPYDINNKLRFADYIYENRTTEVNFGNGIFAAFNVNRPLNGPFYVTTK